LEKILHNQSIEDDTVGSTQDENKDYYRNQLLSVTEEKEESEKR
jgi:hypothetical protein